MAISRGKLVLTASFFNMLVSGVYDYGDYTKVTMLDSGVKHSQLVIEFEIPKGQPIPSEGQRISGQGSLLNIDYGFRSYEDVVEAPDEEHRTGYGLADVTWA